MTHVDHDVLERVTGLEMNLHQRFASRDHNRSIRLLSRQRRHSVSGSISASQEVDRLVCLGGLEVKFTTGSTVQVTAGQITAYNASPITETRPGTYSPAPVEADTDRFEVATLAVDTTVAPASPLGTASGNEWWIVYVVAAETTVESDSARVVFNQTTGEFDATTAAKIKRWTLTPGVARGEPGDNITTVAGTLPAGSTMVAWVWVPSGATSLSNALFFDVRVLPDQSPGPNMCGARGRYGYDGTPDFTNRLIAPSSNTETFSGHFWARIKGQALHAVCPYGAGVSALKIKDPGATWDSGASPTTPAVAWLYLAAPAGYVPRLYAKGTSSIGNGGGTNELAVMHGALVLSSRAPKINIPAGASVKTSGLYDLRPSGTLHMPVSYTVGGITYAFDGLTSDDAICLGPVIYTGYDTPNDAPVIAGPCEVSSDGWIGWPLGGSAMTFDYVCLFDTLSPAVSGAGNDTLTVTVSPKAITGGPVPITGAKITTSAVVSGRYLKFVEGKPRPFALGFVNTYGDDSGQDLSWATEVAFSPQQTTATAVGKGTGEPLATSIGMPASVVTAIRWPFNEPLAT